MLSNQFKSKKTFLAPLNIAVAIVEVARKISIITTILDFTSYKCNKEGERQVLSEGVVFFSDFINNSIFYKHPHSKGILTTLACSSLSLTLMLIKASIFE